MQSRRSLELRGGERNGVLGRDAMKAETMLVKERPTVFALQYFFVQWQGACDD